MKNLLLSISLLFGLALQGQTEGQFLRVRTITDVFVSDTILNIQTTDTTFTDTIPVAVGADGQSAYALWLAQGNTGTEADFLASLVGPSGAGAPRTDLEYAAMFKTGTQTITNSFADITSFSTSIPGTGFSIDGAGGVITFDSTGLYQVMVEAYHAPTTSNNRVQLDVRGLEDTGGGFVVNDRLTWSNYSARNNTQEAGGITGVYLRNYAAGDQLKLQVKLIGSTGLTTLETDGVRVYVVRLEGVAGPAGQDGRDGERWFSGVGIPSPGLGEDGDFYLQTDITGSGDIYEKVSGNWEFQININGQDGSPGPAGQDGTNGERWFTGAGIPSPGLGADGDLYLQTDPTGSGDVYEKISGSWLLQATLSINGTGPAGQDGSSAYEIWLAEGNSGTEADFLASLVGPPGADGQDGSSDWNDLQNIPADIADGDDDTQLTEAQVDAFVANNGYSTGGGGATIIGENTTQVVAAGEVYYVFAGSAGSDVEFTIDPSQLATFDRLVVNLAPSQTLSQNDVVLKLTGSYYYEDLFGNTYTSYTYGPGNGATSALIFRGFAPNQVYILLSN